MNRTARIAALVLIVVLGFASCTRKAQESPPEAIQQPSADPVEALQRQEAKKDIISEDTSAGEGMSPEELDRALAQPADTTRLEDIILPNGKNMLEYMKERGIPLTPHEQAQQKK